jgi:hypothetical protein
MSLYTGVVGEAATCNGSLARTRNVPAAAADTRSAVLRVGSGPNTGQSWIVSGGRRHHIPSGTEFNCWVNPQYRANIEFDVWDHISPAELALFPVESNATISNCGDPENPQF